MSLGNLFDLSGHVVVVTGGNGGIGRSIALGLDQAGAAIAVLAGNEEKNQRVLGEIKALGGPALALRVDVTVRGQLQPALEQVEQTLGPVSILVNNAGITAVGGVLEQAPEDLDRVIETNLNARFLLSKRAAASMLGPSRRMRRRGRVSGVPRFGFCHRFNSRRKRWLRHPMNHVLAVEKTTDLKNSARSSETFRHAICVRKSGPVDGRRVKGDT
jgi:NAD(P)-dependent dehydrogenase (short-subunit alcohol dehydrogenase family)